MKPFDSHPSASGTPRQGKDPGKKKSGMGKQFQPFNVTLSSLTNRTAGEPANPAQTVAGENVAEPQQFDQTVFFAREEKKSVPQANAANNGVVSSAPAQFPSPTQQHITNNNTSQQPNSGGSPEPGSKSFRELRKGDISKVNTLETARVLPSRRTSLENANTVELAAQMPTSSTTIPRPPPHPQSPRSTRPLPLDNVNTARMPGISPPGASPMGPGMGQWSSSSQAIPMPGQMPMGAPVTDPDIGPFRPGQGPAFPMQMPVGIPVTDPGFGPGRNAHAMPIGTPAAATGLSGSQWTQQANHSTRLGKGKALLLIALLCVIVVQGLTIGPTQFLGTQGWAFVLGSDPQSGTNLLTIGGTATQGSGTPTGKLTPQQYIAQIVGKMSLDQKLGQMMMVQFTGPTYSLELGEMITQYHAGSVLLFYSNGNITGSTQLKSLTQEIQGNTEVPMSIAIDQEGGEVDRLASLTGPNPSAEEIGNSNDTAKAKESGQNDATHLSEYGINLNLAPVVDVNTLKTAIVSSEERTYGTDAATVSTMAGAYLQGLQQSGKVIGTLKHFPGLGGVEGDPHQQTTYLSRSRSKLDTIDWGPYYTLIKQGLVHAIMVTHTIVTSIDPDNPASLSPKVQGVLRNDMNYQGVIMTDSLQMAGINLYPGEAAAKAIEAGSDMIMGANSISNLSEMISGIKQAISAGTITEQRINQSVTRILMMKYLSGLLPLPK
jgi:beta-N-acetylhexosaminidase